MREARRLIFAIGLVWGSLAFGGPSEQFFSTNPHTILGLSRGADDDTIRKAHRKFCAENQFEGDRSLTEDVCIERIWIMKRVNMAIAALSANKTYVSPPDTMPNGEPMAAPGPIRAASPEQVQFAETVKAIREAIDPQELRAMWDAHFQREGMMAYLDGLREAFISRFVEFVQEAKEDHGRAKAFYFYGTSNLELAGLASGLDAMVGAMPEGSLRNQFNFVDRGRARDRRVSVGTDRSLLFAYAAAADRVNALDQGRARDSRAGAGTRRSSLVPYAATADRAHSPDESFDWKGAFDSVEAKLEPLREFKTFEPFLNVIGNAWARDPYVFQTEARRALALHAGDTNLLLNRRKRVGLAVMIPSAIISVACLGPCLANMNEFSSPGQMFRIIPGAISGLVAYLSWKEMMTKTDTMVRANTLLGIFQVKVNEAGLVERSWARIIDAMRDLHPWIPPADASVYPYAHGRSNCPSLFNKLLRSVVNYILYP